MVTLQVTGGSRPLPVWRSLLYVPVNVERFVDKAHTRGADCIQLDLEDSVPASDKERARGLVAKAATRVRQAGADVVVRINHPRDLAVSDLEETVRPDVDGITLPKVAGAADVQRMDELVSELELKRGVPEKRTRFIVMIESAEALRQIDEIARASVRIAGITLGAEDLAADAGLEPDEDVLLYPNQQIIFAARAAGVMPLGFLASLARFSDGDDFRAMVQRSRRFGFEGASCVHPGQVPVLNEAFSPSAAEVEHARRVIEAGAVAAQAGRGSFSLDGRMVDAPVLARAQRLLGRHDAVVARQRRTGATAE